MDIDEYNNDDQIEYEEEYHGSRKTSQNIPKEKIPPNIQPKQPGVKQKRRSKNDYTGRDYQCGCGKTYLSYPALYTHIRTKHNGKTPDGTNASQIVNKGGRGRPRKNFLIKEDSNRKRHNDDEQFEDLSEIKELYEKETIEKLELQKKENNYMNIYAFLSDELNSNDYNYNIDEIFPGNFYLNKSLTLLYTKLMQLKNEIEKSDNKYSIDIKDLPSFSCDDLFVFFMLEFKDNLCVKLAKFCVLLMGKLRDYLNKLGWDYLSELMDISSLETEKVFTEDCKNAKYIPEMINDFIDIFLAKDSLTEGERLISIVLCTHFCDWLKRNNITESIVKMQLA